MTSWLDLKMLGYVGIGVLMLLVAVELLRSAFRKGL